MTRGRPGGRGTVTARELAGVAQTFQALHVIPRCAGCRRPCCRLETLVLELDWKRLRALWGLDDQRSSFDARLARGQGPPELRARDGFYYAYRKVCPAYDGGKRSCRVYATGLKPPGCTDFPVYEQDGALVADLRCEGVSLEELERFVSEALGAKVTTKRFVDPEFPFLVTLRCGPSGRAHGGSRESGRARSSATRP